MIRIIEVGTHFFWHFMGVLIFLAVFVNFFISILQITLTEANVNKHGHNPYIKEEKTEDK